jgi:hypothetical protein
MPTVTASRLVLPLRWPYISAARYPEDQAGQLSAGAVAHSSRSIGGFIISRREPRQPVGPLGCRDLWKAALGAPQSHGGAIGAGWAGLMMGRLTSVVTFDTCNS